MRRNPVWSARTAVATESKPGGALACLLFALLLSGAFVAGALWAAHPWIQ